MAASSVIRVSVLGDAKSLQQAMKKAGASTQSFSDKAKTASRAITNNITLPLIGAAAGLIHLANTQEDAERKMKSTFDSMGASAWTNTDALLANASALQSVTTFGDEAIIGLQDLLLTFGNVTNQVGAGNDIFDQATEIGLDMSAALGQNLKESAIQLGKALNDPIAGISALSRVGITFTDDQKDMIKTLTKTGDTLGAQKIILAELESQFGGTAAAMADTASGKIKQAMNTLGDLGETVGAGLATIAADAIPKFVAGVSVVKDFFDGLPGPVQKAILIIGGLTLALAALYAHPVVAGLALVAGAITLIGGAAADQKKHIVGLKDALEDSAGAADEAALAYLSSQDEAGELAVMAARAGLTLEDLANAALNDQVALDKMESAMKRNKDQGNLTDEQITILNTTVELLGTRLGEAQAEIDLVAQAEADAQGPVEDLTGSLEAQAEASQAVLDATVAMADEQRKAVDPAFALRDANDKYRDALAKVTQMQEAGATGTRDYRDATSDLIEAQGDLNYAVANFDASDSTDELYELGRQAGLSEDEIRDLITAIQNLNSTPVNIGGQGGIGDVTTTPGGHIPLQTGGIVPGPTGSAVPVLAHAGEVVLNPSQQRNLLNGNGGGLTVNVAAGTIVTENELEDVLIRILSRYGLRNGATRIGTL